MAAHTPDPNQRRESPLPTVNERLGHLKPSKELLEYYRRKIAEYDGEYEEMVRKLELYKCTYEEQHKTQWELRQREEEIAELQKALSDMQVYLFQEREHVLRLYAENDRLKLRELADRKKIQHLLSLSKTTEPEITYFHHQPPAKAIVTQHKPRDKDNGSRAVSTGKRPLAGRGPGGHKRDSTGNVRPVKNPANTEDNQTLLLQIESLQAQLEEQTKLAKEQVNALLEDRRVHMEEQQAQRERDADKIKMMQEKLRKTHDLLYDSTKDFLELKYEIRANERHWMVDRDRFVQEIDHLREQLDITGASVLEVSGEIVEPRQAQIIAVQSLRHQLEQTQKLSEMYREQCIGLEDELARIRERTDVSEDIFKERTEKMSKRLTLMNSRYENLEKRRALEVEGFKTDIKMLRDKLKNVEKQLFKVTVNMGDDYDEQVLRNVRHTAGRSKKLVGELHNLKAKIYSLENDVRHMG
ncbi:Coiled-coil domain-containing protein 77 [Desmophyllum pertusum]|uniref:Coiled-coil domain-containing protein 77 n=1 Tax=Desmophyllum pertusum TaxID=174260 RepID=A0A9W9ZCS5_9CNID|nr:Coiled-coil domain-containing protein 77 [Desmophyllum pertusum]